MEVLLISKDNGEIIHKTTAQMADTQKVIPENFKMAREFILKNNEVNKELYRQLIRHVGKTLAIESDNINGWFDIGTEGNDLVLRESL